MNLLLSVLCCFETCKKPVKKSTTVEINMINKINSRMQYACFISRLIKKNHMS